MDKGYAARRPTSAAAGAGPLVWPGLLRRLEPHRLVVPELTSPRCASAPRPARCAAGRAAPHRWRPLHRRRGGARPDHAVFVRAPAAHGSSGAWTSRPRSPCRRPRDPDRSRHRGRRARRHPARRFLSRPGRHAASQRRPSPRWDRPRPLRGRGGRPVAIAESREQAADAAAAVVSISTRSRPADVEPAGPGPPRSGPTPPARGFDWADGDAGG